MSTSEGPRKRKASSRLADSSETLAKKLKDAHNKRKNPTQLSSTPAIHLSRHSSTSSVPSHSHSPPVTVEEEEDDELGVKIQSPCPKESNQLVEASDGSDDDVEDDPGSNVEGANTEDEDVQEDYHEQMEGEQPEDDPQTKL
ncbi:hypothetical protein C0992_000861, partial [Termitomyces sp. T32_za158]